MVRRRGTYDPLATSAEPRWLKVLDNFREELSSRRIEPGADLRSVMRHEAACWVANGWDAEAEDGGRHGFFFVRRGRERRLVMLTAYETAPELAPSPENGKREGRSRG